MNHLYTPALKAVARAACLIFMTSLTPAWAVINKPAEPYISYTVQPGDTLKGLSLNLLTDPKRWNALASLNGLKNPHLIYPGWVLDVPLSWLNLDKQPKVATGGVIQAFSGAVTVNGAVAQAGMQIPEGGRVQTAANSSVVLSLSDGSRVQLMPKSLAQVVSQHGYALKDPASGSPSIWFSGVIRLVEGVLDVIADTQAKRKEPLNVITPTALVGVRGTRFRVAYEDPGTRTTRTEVLEGKVRAEQPEQTLVAEVARGFGVAIKPGEREIKVKALLPGLPEAQLSERVLRTEAEKKALWTVGTLAGAAGYRAELAQDLQFERIVNDTKSSTPVLDFSSSPNGIYYARVRGFDGDGIEGYNAVRRIVLADAPPAVPAPRPSWTQEINWAATATHLPEGVQLRLNSQITNPPNQLHIQVALDAGFTQGLVNLPLDAQLSAVLKDVRAGDRRFIRVTGTDAQKSTATSPRFLLQLPANWGDTVFGMVSALKPLD
jgi:hypothetical protein